VRWCGEICIGSSKTIKSPRSDRSMAPAANQRSLTDRGYLPQSHPTQLRLRPFLQNLPAPLLPRTALLSPVLSVELLRTSPKLLLERDIPRPLHWIHEPREILTALPRLSPIRCFWSLRDASSRSLTCCWFGLPAEVISTRSCLRVSRSCAATWASCGANRAFDCSSCASERR